MPGDHIFKRSLLLREAFVGVVGAMIGVSLLTGSSVASGRSPRPDVIPQPGSLVTETYEFTGQPESFSVPEGIESIGVKAFGAAGGYGGVSVEPVRNDVLRPSVSDATTVAGAPEGSLAPGGDGGEVEASIPVLGGQTLTVNVGGVGSNSQTPSRRSGFPTVDPQFGGQPELVVALPHTPGAPGGYNGGGEGGDSENFYFSGDTFLFFGGGGGGASTLSLADTSLVVAGGGGGGGANRGERSREQAGVARLTADHRDTVQPFVALAPPGAPPSTGGNGGGSNAEQGAGESGTDGSAMGGAGGSEDTPASVREFGGAGQGDNSADDPHEDGGFTGGGGGGGYYGGLGGSFGICIEACEEAGAGGGGGGSDYAEPSASGVILKRAANAQGAPGQIVLSYFEPYPTETEAIPNPARASTGETITLTGTVTASGPCAGTIEFQLDGAPTGPPIPVSSNSAQTTITAPAPGSHEITAIYSGTPSSATAAGCLPSTSEPSTLTTTTPYPTTTTATPKPSKASTGETITLTGTVTASGPCAGTIEFQLDGTATGPPIPVSSNSAQTTITAPPPGSHEITAIYSGAPTTSSSPGCLPSTSEPTTLTTTTPYPTTTTATPEPSKASTGETITLTGTVEAAGSCAGTIEFQLDGTPTGPPIPVSSNSAQTTITAPPPGSHKITAIYSGAPTTSSSPGCLPSKSEPTTLTTTEPFPTSTTATPEPSKASTGETVTLTGTVTASGPCAGTIEFQLDEVPVGLPVPVSSNSAQTTITAPPPGSHKITAIYSGAPTTSSSPGCLPSKSEPTTLTTTEPFPTTTTATPSPAKAATGETVTLTGTVTASGPCAGTIEFQLDGTPTGPPIPVNSNSAQTTIAAPPAGSHKIVAIYSGAPTTSTSPGCLPSKSEPTTLTTTSVPVTDAEGLVPIKKSLACQSSRHFAIHLQLPRRLKLLGAAVYIDGKLAKRLGQNVRIYKLNLRGRPYATITITLSAREPDGHTVTGERIYHTCRAHKLPAHTKFKI